MFAQGVFHNYMLEMHFRSAECAFSELGFFFYCIFILFQQLFFF